ncbi:MAG: Gmad2 immunoglobulin-like domain-containing protein [Candidatus Andersenbacteria bacterium]|nr:Gmad2 immunoglobulin-like domain-containing protein [Candidatus Andersenbacteria bacterium]
MNMLLKVLTITLLAAAIVISILTLNWRTQVAQAPTPLPASPQPSISNNPEKSDTIRVTTPQPNEITAGTISVAGEARGTWFFEASFPIQLEDASGKIISSTTAQAQSDWMTTDFVPFKATLAAPREFTGSATLVLKKDNPSGLPQNDETFKIPITVKK